jgi:hypothetical protein
MDLSRRDKNVGETSVVWNVEGGEFISLHFSKGVVDAFPNFFTEASGTCGSRMCLVNVA